MSKVKVKIDEVPFTTKQGKVINVGDEVFSITSGYCGDAKYRKSRYIGMTDGGVRLEWFEQEERTVDAEGNVVSTHAIWKQVEANVPKTKRAEAGQWCRTYQDAQCAEYDRLMNTVYGKKTFQKRMTSKLYYNRIFPIVSSVTDLL